MPSPLSSLPDSEFGTKIKDVYFEIQDYGFYHSPSEINNPDERFIGREAVREKLTTILTNNETKSGTYLVTGFRGIGKTSLINKVLSDISGIFTRRIQITRYLRILFPLIVFSMLDLEKFPILVVILPTVLWFSVLIYLLYSDPRRNTLKNYRSRENYRFIFRKFLNNFFLDKEKISRFRYRIIFQDLFVFLFIHLIGIIAFDLVHADRFFLKLRTYLGIFFLILSVSSFLRGWKRFSAYPYSYRLRKMWVALVENIVHKVNFSQRQIIRINLGHDELRERDILRIIAQRLKTHYDGRSRISLYAPIDTLFRIFGILAFYLFLSISYYNLPTYTYVLEIKKKASITRYLPSQYLFVYADEISTDNKEEEALFYETNRRFEKLVDFSTENYIKGLNRQLPSGISPYSEDELSSYAWYKQVLIYVDYYLTSMYHRFLRIMQSNPSQSLKENYLGKYFVHFFHGHFSFIPPHLDYFFIIYLLVGWNFINLTLRYKYFGMPNHRQVKQRLKRLIDRLSSEITITQEQNGRVGWGPDRLRMSSVGILRRKNQFYPILDIREIEAEIISILHDISRIPKVFLRPEFVFIFDELDKIELKRNISIIAKEEEDRSSYFKKEEKNSSTVRIRQRQQAIIKILSNLKHFLNTAQAKFLFIAGREMFDASLADIADRDSFLGSIFHDVIYVNSFLTDSTYTQSPDVTKMVETYVCNFILPIEYCSDPSLKRVNQYLEEEIFVEKQEYEKKENELLKLKREKALYQLTHFITYLTYRSNGAPKKITRLFEQFIHSVSHETLKNTEENLVIGKNHRNLYLLFDYKNQYALGMTTYLTHPFLQTISKFTQDYGDKLLVSSAFLIDHLYKFHNFSFEWRNLELTPEIIDINKAPELRNFISQIIEFLSNSHIQEIVSGLHDLKFNNKISSEIDFLSKISEFESAAFNFTLDESLEVKNYLNRKIQLLLKNNSYLLNMEEPSYVHAIGTNYMLLGDLHYFDQEYADAINHYQQAIHLLKSNFKKQMKEEKAPEIYEFILLIRNMLKLGLAFERKNSYDFAFLTYAEISREILAVRFLNVRRMGIKEVTLSPDELWNITDEDLSDIAPKYKSKGKLTQFEQFEQAYNKIKESKGRFVNEGYQLNENRGILILVKEPLFKKKNVEKDTIIFDEDLSQLPEHPGIKESYSNHIEKYDSKEARKILGFSDEFIEVLEILPDTYLKIELNQRISSLEGMRLLYQPFIAKLHIIEKNNLGGITISDIERTMDEFDFLIKLTKRDEKFMVEAEFFNKVGDVLFYKNGVIDDSIEKLIQGSFLPGNTSNTEDYIASSAAYLFYFYSLKKLIIGNKYFRKDKDFLGYFDKTNTLDRIHLGIEDERFLLETIMKSFVNEETLFTKGIARHKYLNTVANTLSELGDVCISLSSREVSIRRDFLYAFLRLINLDLPLLNGNFYQDKQNAINKLLEFINSDLSPLEKSFFYYYIAGSFFLHSGNNRQYSFQLTKFLYVIKYYLIIGEEQGNDGASKLIDRGMLRILEKSICRRILIGMARADDNSYRMEVQKMEEIFREDIQNMPFGKVNLSFSADFREVILLFEDLKILSGNFNPGEYKLLTNPYSTINSKFNRVRELELKAKQNHIILEQLGFLQDKDSDKEINFNKSIHNSNTQEQVFRIFGIRYKPFEVLEFLISDSIFCYFEAIRTMEIFGLSYIDNHSLKGRIYMKLATWCSFYEKYKDHLGSKGVDEIFPRLERSLSQIDTLSLNSTYNYERALQEFYASVETHKGSRSYKNMINHMYYLDDDFNDYYTHFCASLERFRINTGLVRHWIRKVKGEIAKDKEDYYVSSFIA